MHRAVVHIPEGTRVGQALNNVRHLLDDLPGEIEIVVVLNGDAVGALAPGSADIDAMRKLKVRGVRVVACARSLRKHGFDPGTLIENVVTVPGGVTEVVRLEADGFAYIRP